jgi:hypothetical protein
VMLRGCGSSGIVRGFFMTTPLVAPSLSNHCPLRRMVPPTLLARADEVI